MNSKTILLSSIDFDNSPMARGSLYQEAVNDYAEAYKQKLKLPPIVVFRSTDAVFLADGNHRCAALHKLGETECQAEVRLGGYEQALRYAIAANREHGLRRTNSDKAKCVKLASKQWPKLTNRQIADLCGVSHTLVDNIRKSKKPGSVATVATTENASRSESTDGPKINPVDNSAKPATPEPQKPPENGKVVVDKTGYHVPKTCIEIWQRAPEVKQLINQVMALRSLINDFGQNRDKLWIGINFQDVDIDLQTVISNLRNAMPDVVCPTCSGHPELQLNNNCTFCHGKGFISEWFWKGPCVPAKTREMRENIVANYRENL